MIYNGIMTIFFVCFLFFGKPQINDILKKMFVKEAIPHDYHFLNYIEISYFE